MESKVIEAKTKEKDKVVEMQEEKKDKVAETKENSADKAIEEKSKESLRHKVVEMKTEVTGTEQRTFEIRRIWDREKSGCAVIELYPTIEVGTTDTACMDLSTMHLLGHLSELGDFGSVSVCNLFSKVCGNGKPSARNLKMDIENLSYIGKLLEEKKKEDFPVILAWGNSLARNKTTIEMKRKLLKMLLEKGYEEKTYCITADGFSEKSEGQYNLFHPLFLGIRARDGWELSKISIKELLKELLPLGTDDLSEQTEKETQNEQKRRKRKNDSPKNNTGL